MSSDAVVVRKGVGWGYLPPYLPEPVPQIVTALDPEAGTLALLDPAGAVPAAVALIAVQLFPFWKRFPFVHSSGHSSQSTGYYKQIKHLVVLVVCQLLDRFPVASRVPAALSVRLHRVFTDCLKLFSRKSEILACAVNYDLCPIPTHVQHIKLWGGGVGSAPSSQDPGHLAPLLSVSSSGVGVSY